MRSASFCDMLGFAERDIRAKRERYFRWSESDMLTRRVNVRGSLGTISMF